MQNGGSERSRARFFDRFVIIFVFHTFRGSARTEFVKTARSHISIQIFPYACPGFARTFGAFVFKNAAFYRAFRDFRGTRNCYPRLRKCSKPRVFTRFSRFSDPVDFGSFLIVFSNKCENHAFSRVFDAAGPRFRACFFIVSARSPFETLPKTTRFIAFFASLWPRRRSFVFHILFRSFFFAFFETLRKPRVFTRFSRFGRECDAFFGLPESSGNSFSAFLSSGAA